MLDDFKNKMQRSLDGLGWGEVNDWLRYSAGVSMGSLVLVSVLGTGDWTIIFGVLSFLPLIGAYVTPAYFWAAKQRKMECDLPQALYRAASNAFMPIEELIAELSEGDSELAGEFRKANMQIKNGISVEDALSTMASSNDSRLLTRTIDLLLQCYRTGADMAKAFKETAEEISGIATVMREQAVNSTVEKYTLLLAGGIIVPLVLGALVAMVGSLNFTGLSELGFGSGGSEQILANALAGSQIYIIEYAILASVFVAYQENSIEKSIVYMVVLVPLSFALFMLAKTFV